MTFGYNGAANFVWLCEILARRLEWDTGDDCVTILKWNGSSMMYTDCVEYIYSHRDRGTVNEAAVLLPSRRSSLIAFLLFTVKDS